jgi:hypothetical protein
MDDTVKEFLVESYDNLDQLDRDLVEFQRAPIDRGILSSIYPFRRSACWNRSAWKGSSPAGESRPPTALQCSACDESQLREKRAVNC